MLSEASTCFSRELKSKRRAFFKSWLWKSFETTTVLKGCQKLSLSETFFQPYIVYFIRPCYHWFLEETEDDQVPQTVFIHHHSPRPWPSVLVAQPPYNLLPPCRDCQIKRLSVFPSVFKMLNTTAKERSVADVFLVLPSHSLKEEPRTAGRKCLFLGVFYKRFFPRKP